MYYSFTPPPPPLLHPASPGPLSLPSHQRPTELFVALILELVLRLLSRSYFLLQHLFFSAPLENDSDALSASDARGSNGDIYLVVSSKFIGEVGDDPAATGSEGVAEADSASVAVRLIRIEIENLHAREELGCERLVDLHTVHLADMSCQPP